MMSEDVTENGHINEHGEEHVDEQQATPSLNSPRHSVTTPQDTDEPEIEFFERKRSGSESLSEGDSPRGRQDKDNVSHHSRSYVTVSPPASPSEPERRRGGWVWHRKCEGCGLAA